MQISMTWQGFGRRALPWLALVGSRRKGKGELDTRPVYAMIIVIVIIHGVGLKAGDDRNECHQDK